MKKLCLIFLVLFVFKGWAQPITSIINGKTIPIQFKISGKSNIEIENANEIIEKIKKDDTFKKFFFKWKDSLNLEPHSSLMLFKLDENVLLFNETPNNFELDGTVSCFIKKYFRSIKFKNLKRRKNILGFYLHYIPEERNFKIEFVECRSDRYFTIYESTVYL